MLTFFSKNAEIYAVESKKTFSNEDVKKLIWLFSNADYRTEKSLQGIFIGPRHEMVTPWSTNAVEITHNIGLTDILRIEVFRIICPDLPIEEAKKQALLQYDPMLEEVYTDLQQNIFEQNMQAQPVQYISDIETYTKEEGLALSKDEISYLENLSTQLGRELTDSEIFGFSQVNSEHCRHKIFNGQFIIDGVPCEKSLFDMIKQTSKANPNRLVSAYKDNVAFVEGDTTLQLAPLYADRPSAFYPKEMDTVISLKAETHNFPTTVEPFNGAATGSGGEIRDRMAGGIGSIPMAGTAVYMTSYPRLNPACEWQNYFKERPWLYQSPEKILIKASNGASDFGNKFGQPLICGSLLTFEHQENGHNYGYDKVIMLAGGIGYANKLHAFKKEPSKGDVVVVLGGDNYRIGMGGGAVSSVATGEFASSIELNAVQRSNPEMQKRVFNVIRSLTEISKNPIISIHDHGAGGHLNCLSELLEATGGEIDIQKLPIGDKTLSAKEIIGNESQERMGLIVKEKDLPLLEMIARRENAPMYVVGKVTGTHQLIFKDKDSTPINLKLEDMFGNPPKTVIYDTTQKIDFEEVKISQKTLEEQIINVLKLESVGCKDWLTNKVDRSITGKVAHQQCCGVLQLPLNDVGVVALDFLGEKGIATSIGHAPAIGLIDAAAGSVMSIAESLSNIIWAPIEGGLPSVSLSANWMWACNNEGESARLYEAVKAASEFAIQLGINIPTGKDSLSMTQKYPDGQKVLSPGTLIVSAVAEVANIRKTVSPVLQLKHYTKILYIDLSCDNFHLGGSAYAQTISMLGDVAPTIKNAPYFANVFAAVQKMIQKDMILSGHDISAGGMITALLEMTFADNRISLDVNLSAFPEKSLEKVLFSEKSALLIQVKDDSLAETILDTYNVHYIDIATINGDSHHQTLYLRKDEQQFSFDIDKLRDAWYEPSYQLDILQSGKEKATERYDNFKNQELVFRFPRQFKGQLSDYKLPIALRHNIIAALIREKGTNGDREMAESLFAAGFVVRDVHVSDIMNGSETLDDVQMVVFPGGFSHSDVLGSAKGWASVFMFNQQAKNTLERFFARTDTLSLGVCNGCQLMVELGLIYPEHQIQPKMLLNDSHKFESAFLNVDILENQSIMLSSLAGSRLGIWVAHGEGKFDLPEAESAYHIPVKYSYSGYPGNPNGSAYNAAAICSHDGRHLAIMPHLERAVYSWQWAHYPAERNDEVSPWIEAFINAFKWIKKTSKQSTEKPEKE
ncbi:MAG: phosphoribosylformylglycinamidine synthase [Bacteroidales bacterium]|jgi:phosphoribosylformylglycinamidine synthase|nr:phosphoribosylformylglycinamidine synthase [Bacteroidales bacterium]